MFYLTTKTETSLWHLVFYKINRTLFLDKARMMDNVQRNICAISYMATVYRKMKKVSTSMQHKMLYTINECKVNMGCIQLESTKWNYTNRKKQNIRKPSARKWPLHNYYIRGEVFSNGVYILSSSFLDTGLFSIATFIMLHSIKNYDFLCLIKYPTYWKMFQIQIISLKSYILHCVYQVLSHFQEQWYTDFIFT
jgi:hypothetical protein